jgi:hypothetical protein
MWTRKEASALSHKNPEERAPSEQARREKHEVSAPLDPGRTDLYKMISRLPEEQLETEYDDEPLTAEDLAAITAPTGGR